ncbi:MAG: GerW family sporulation protein [Lachnospiraceae bacterium]|nr:GerW family sporulation protein [Lachnospiraceae bacterium]
MASNFNEVVDSMLKGMDGFLSSKTVVGEPTVIGDTVIVPFVDVSFGVGAGDFRGEKKANGAGGLTGKMSPSAVLVIQNGTTRLVNIKNQDGVTKILDMVPDLVNKFTSGNKDDSLTDDEVKEAAFPDSE